MYFTVNAESSSNQQKSPINVDFIVKTGEQPEKRLLLCKDGEWAGGLSGTFTTSVSEALPENNLFLLLQKEDETADDFLDTISAISGVARQGGHRAMSLNITQQSGKPVSIPIRSVERGPHSLSFYRQSEHQTV